VDPERLSRLCGALLAPLGAILAVLGLLSGDATTIALGVAAVVGGAGVYWATGWFWDWYWDLLDGVQSGDIQLTTTLRVVLLVAFVPVGSGLFAAFWWLASFFGVVTDGALAGDLISRATVAGGVVGAAFGGGSFVATWMLRSQDGTLDVTKGSRGFRLLYALSVCPLVGYWVLLFVHPPSAVALAVGYLVSFVAGAGVLIVRTSELCLRSGRRSR